MLKCVSCRFNHAQRGYSLTCYRSVCILCSHEVIILIIRTLCSVTKRIRYTYKVTVIVCKDNGLFACYGLNQVPIFVVCVYCFKATQICRRSKTVTLIISKCNNRFIGIGNLYYVIVSVILKCRYILQSIGLFNKIVSLVILH